VIALLFLFLLLPLPPGTQALTQWSTVRLRTLPSRLRGCRTLLMYVFRRCTTPSSLSMMRHDARTVCVWLSCDQNTKRALEAGGGRNLMDRVFNHRVKPLAPPSSILFNFPTGEQGHTVTACVLTPAHVLASRECSRVRAVKAPERGALTDRPGFSGDTPLSARSAAA
jgi:hypothetical protein